MVLRSFLSSLVLGLGVLINWGIAAPDAIATVDKPDKTITPLTVTPSASPDVVLPNGVYLYGEQTEPDRPQTTYVVLAVQGGALSGAIYQLNSDYNCFTATPYPDHLALHMVDRHSNESFIYTIARSQTAVLASTRPTLERHLNLVGFYQLDTVRDSDRALLATCHNPQPEMMQ